MNISVLYFQIDFENYQKYQRLHAQLNDSGNFLLQVSDLSACARIREKLMKLNRKWKLYQDRFKETNNEHYLKYYECEHSLSMIKERLAKIDSLMSKQCKCSVHSIGKYQEELQKAYSDIECLDANVKLVHKLTSRIDLKHDQSQLNRFVESVRQAETKLTQLRNLMPEVLKNLTKIHSLVASVDEGLHNVDCWMIEADALIRSEPDQLNLDQLMRQHEKEKVHFNSLYNFY